MKLTYRPCPACGTTYPLPDSARLCYWCRSGYAAALHDAITAANNERSKWKARDWDDAIDAVVAAIEGLGGWR